MKLHENLHENLHVPWPKTLMFRCLKGVQQLGAAVQSVLVVEGRRQDATQTPVQIALERWDGMAGMGKEWQL